MASTFSLERIIIFLYDVSKVFYRLVHEKVLLQFDNLGALLQLGENCFDAVYFFVRFLREFDDI